MEVNMTYLVLKPNSINNIISDMVYKLNDGDSPENIAFLASVDDYDTALAIAEVAYLQFVINPGTYTE